MKHLSKFVVSLVLFLICNSSQAQTMDSELYKFALSEYISFTKNNSNFDTIYVRNDASLSNKIPPVIGGTHIKLLEKENLYKNFIVLLPIESKTKIKKVSLIEYSVSNEEDFIGYMGGYCFVVKINKHGNRILLKKIEKINY